jgi:adenylate cyclase
LDGKAARQKDDRMNETSIRFVDSETRAPLPLSSPERALSAANLPEAIDEIKRWATEQGLRGATARDLFEGYCRRLEAHGFALMRAYVSTQTLHPQWTGYGYTWKREWQSVREQQFARGGPISQEWLASPLYALIQRSQAGE